MDIINSYCKHQQRADRWKMSENSKFSESASAKMALEPPLRKVGSQNLDTIRRMNGYEKSPSFMALAQTVFGTDQKKTTGGQFPPHHQ